MENLGGEILATHSFISSRKERSLARLAYQEAEENGWLGLGMEVRLMCKELNIPEINKYRMNKI